MRKSRSFDEKKPFNLFDSKNVWKRNNVNVRNNMPMNITMNITMSMTNCTDSYGR